MVRRGSGEDALARACRVGRKFHFRLADYVSNAVNPARQIRVKALFAHTRPLFFTRERARGGRTIRLANVAGVRKSVDARAGQHPAKRARVSFFFFFLSRNQIKSIPRCIRGFNKRDRIDSVHIPLLSRACVYVVAFSRTILSL